MLALLGLISEFSQAIVEGGIIPILSDHAHASHAGLRLNSLWAFKHLMINSSAELRIQCLARLGAPWLKQIISNDQSTTDNLDNNSFFHRQMDREDGNTTPMRMSTPNAAGEQVDLLNAVDIDSRESSQPLEEDNDQDTRMSDSFASLNQSDDGPPQQSSSRSLPRKPRPTNLNLNSVDPGSVRFSELPDEVAIVQQALEVVGNLMLAPEDTQMIDHVFREFGQDDLFKILVSKLRPRVLITNTPSTLHDRNKATHHTIPPHPSILLATIRCICNIAANRQHKNLIMPQTTPRLLEFLLPCLSHADPQIRATGCWVIVNLTWDEDAADQGESRARTKKLVELGFYERVREMERDGSVDVKERSRNALQQMQSGLR